MDPACTEGCFPLSEPETKRLLPYAASMGVAGYESERTTRTFLKTMRALFPDKVEIVNARFPQGGTHARLALTADGACVFLAEAGCVLPREARPWYCQLFPIWIRRGYFDYFAAPDCLASCEAANVKGVFALTGLDPADARDLYLSLCRDWGLVP